VTKAQFSITLTLLRLLKSQNKRALKLQKLYLKQVKLRKQ